MGRHSTHPEVEDLDTPYWHVTRVRDPDDEFATKQVLTSEGWADYHGPETLGDVDALGFSQYADADQAVQVYALGYYDAADRVRCAELGS